MASKIWVYTLQVEGVVGLELFDPQGRAVANPKIHTIYTALNTNANISDKGDKALFHATSNIVNPTDIQVLVDAYVPQSEGAHTQVIEPKTDKESKVKKDKKSKSETK